MGIRFRKGINLGGGVRLNISKSGLGISGGVKGARIGIGPRGIRQTASIYGTGLSYVKENRLSSKNNKQSVNKKNYRNSEQVVVNYPKQTESGNWFMVIAIIGLFLMPAEPVIGSITAMGFGYLFYKSKVKPGNVSAKHYNKALAKYKRKKYQDAIFELKESLNYNHENLFSLKLITVIYYDHLEDYKNTVTFLREYTRLVNDSMLKIVLAECYFKLENYDLAIGLLQSFKIVNNEESENERIILLAKAFIEKENYELAIEQLKMGPVNKRKMDYYTMEAKYLLGVAYVRNGENKKAKTQLTKVYSEDINYKDIQHYAEQAGII